MYAYLLLLALTPLSVYCNFNSNRARNDLDGSSWMKDNMGLLGSRKLQQICIPGSHDAGMSEFNKGTALAHPCNVLTQSLGVGGQLALGVRYFDIRPVISGGRYLTGHYSRLPGGSWQGGNGQSIESIVSDLNSFTKANPEVIVIRLAHSLNTDLGNSKYRKFTQPEWDNLFHILDKTNNLYVHKDPNVHLPSLTINQLTDNGKRAAVLYILSDPESGVQLGRRSGQGYFYHTNMNMYHKYSKTNDLSHMFKDQINKMKQFSKNNYFLLSWTLTQGGKDAALCSLHLAKSIKTLAEKANSNFGDLYPEISVSSYPNVLYADNIRNTDITKVALAINKKLNF